MEIKYGVIGTGGLGGFFGGKLAQAGGDIHFLLRGDYLHVREKGLQVDSVGGNFLVQSPACYQSADEMPVCDVVLVCLKTTSNHLLPQLLKPILHSKSLVVLIQNGLNVEDELARLMPELNIAGGLAFICSQKIGPGHIEHVDLGRLVLGIHSNGGGEILKRVCADFQQAGVPASLSDDLRLARWQKLVWNVPFNGLSVVLNASTDELIANDETRGLALEIMLEVVCAANQCGFQLQEAFARKMIETTMKMKPYAPSMKQDFEHRRPMEIEAIYSRPIQEARAAGFEMERTAMLERQLLFLEAKQQ